ncbi:MAG: lipid-A-disaccharide synthase, partial [Pseudomonadota bacterium]
MILEHLANNQPSINSTVLPPLTIALIVGESSGDVLGEHLMMALTKRYPNVRFIGVGGSRMISAGLTSIFPMDELAVMGVVDVLARLPRLLKLRRKLIQTLLREKPDAMVGIDAPDFNLGLEIKLRKHGIRTFHCVAPSVWAWRSSRVEKIRKAVEHLLVLFPFEVKWFQKHSVPVTCVGHPLADVIPLEDQQSKARQRLGLDPDRRWIAVLPGSRRSELKFMLPLWIEVMARLSKEIPSIGFLIPVAQTYQETWIGQMIATRAELHGIPVQIATGQSHTFLAASELALMTSGTATLEAMLFKRPMVVGFKWHPITHFCIAPFIRTPWIALPNILAQKKLVPEFVQSNCTSERLFKAAHALLNHPQKTEQIRKRFH